MTTFDQNRYKWRKDHKVDGRFIREPIGGELIEDVWNITNHGDQNLFLGLYINLSTSIRAEDLMTHLREAWKSLRWEFPIIALQVCHVPVEGRPFPRPYMVYDVARSTSEVDVWAENTTLLVEGYKDLDDLRYHIGQDPLPSADFMIQTYVYALQRSPNSYGILIRTSHTPFDGSGLKIVGNKLLYHLSNYIGNPDHPKLETEKMRWGEESANLTPAMLEVIQSYVPAVKDSKGNVVKEEIPGEIREGPVYDQALVELMDGLGKGSARSHPFKSILQPIFDVKRQNPRTLRLHYTFTLEESEKIKAACAPTELMPEKLTINHLVHGSLSLLPIIDNPPEKGSDSIVFFWGLVDARVKLVPKYRKYPGFCLAMSAIQLPVSLYDEFSHEDQRTLVLEFAKATRQEYKRQAQSPSLASLAGEQMDMVVQGPPPPPWCGPWYSGDGRGSLHLSPRHEVDGRQVLELTNFFIGVNKCEPGPFFRATEWNDRIMLSVDFNELAVETKTVQHWMDLWRDLLLTL